MALSPTSSHGGGATSPVTAIQRVLSASDLHTLDTVPVELISAPGPAQVITLVNAWAFYRYGTTGYNPAGTILLSPQPDIGYVFASSETLAPDVASSALVSLRPQPVSVPGAISLGASLVVWSGGPWGSDGDGTLIVSALYEILDTA